MYHYDDYNRLFPTDLTWTHCCQIYRLWTQGCHKIGNNAFLRCLRKPNHWLHVTHASRRTRSWIKGWLVRKVCVRNILALELLMCFHPMFSQQHIIFCACHLSHYNLSSAKKRCWAVTSTPSEVQYLGQLHLNFGKYNGQSFKWLVENDVGYIK